MAGPWGAPVNVGNTATFGSQSGGVSQLSSGQLAMNSNRWSSNWPTKGGQTRQLMLPISEVCIASMIACDPMLSAFFHRAPEASSPTIITAQSSTATTLPPKAMVSTACRLVASSQMASQAPAVVVMQTLLPQMMESRMIPRTCSCPMASHSGTRSIYKMLMPSLKSIFRPNSCKALRPSTSTM